MGVVTALAFFACIVLHELGHAVVARSGGMPIRGITLFLFGGVAELEGEPLSAGTEFRMAIAGPVVSPFWSERLRIDCTRVSLMAFGLRTAVSVNCTVCCVVSLLTARLCSEKSPTPPLSLLDSE